MRLIRGRQFAGNVAAMAGGVTASTWNAADKDAGITLSVGNTVATITASNSGVRGTQALASGKKYFEVLAGATFDNRATVGIGTAAASRFQPGRTDALGSSYRSDGNIYTNNSSGLVFGATWTNGDIIGVAVDRSLHFVWFAKNNVWQASGNPATGASPQNYITTNDVFPSFGGETSTTGSGALIVTLAAFNFTPPTGFTAWG
jgi:urease beta subunit